MKTTRSNQYAVLYRAFGKWNWYERSTWTKASIKDVARDVAREMHSKCKIVKATLVLQD